MRKLSHFILLVFTIIILLCPQKIHAQALDEHVVVNEIMPNPNTGETEWIELYSGTDIPLTDYTIEDGTAVPKSLSPCSILNNYLLLQKGTGDCKFGFTLNNDGDTVKLKKSAVVVDEVTYGEDLLDAPIPTQGESIARIPNGQDTNIDNDDFVLIKTPSPSAKNELPDLPPLVVVTELLPLDTDISTNLKVNFSWKNSNEAGTKFKFFLSKNEDPEIDNLLSATEMILTETSFTKTLSNWGQYYWKVIVYDDFDEISSDVLTFKLIEPIYSSSIVINEVMAHPSTGTENEFIELYNLGDKSVDLSGWFLDDIDGGSDFYKIENNTMIEPDEYMVFYKSVTKLTLNDSGDWARLMWPDGKLVSSTNYDSYAALDFSWSRDESGNFVWSTKSSPCAKNTILVPLKDAGGTDEEEPVINKIPIKIKTSKVKNYEDMLVEIQGKVVETYGSTFYIDDSSGRAKVYIQAQTEIKKPKMYKGDIFQIFGVVNLYRNVWRILPRSQSDIKLIQSAKQNLPVEPKVKSVITNSVVKKASTVPSLQARAPNKIAPIIKQVKAAETIVPLNSDIQVQNPWWSQIAKLLIGLSLIFMVILVVKIKSFKLVKIVGGHFGDDDT
jgi:hypothetical protein